MGKPFLYILIFLTVSCNSSPITKKSNEPVGSPLQVEEHGMLGEAMAKKQLGEALQGKGQPFTWDTLIKDPSTAVAVAEPILFDVFGKEVILGEKPYEVYLIDGYWYISGTIPKGMNGGAFEIIFSAKDGTIIRLTHYK